MHGTIPHLVSIARAGPDVQGKWEIAEKARERVTGNPCPSKKGFWGASII
jgi:hypothetical protein